MTLSELVKRYEQSRQDQEARIRKTKLAIQLTQRDIKKFKALRSKQGFFARLFDTRDYGKHIDTHELQIRSSLAGCHRALAKEDSMQSEILHQCLNQTMTEKELTQIDEQQLLVEFNSQCLYTWEALVKDGQSASQKVNTALREIDDAQTMEVLDLATSSKAISLISTMANSDASDCIKQAQKAIAKYIDQVKHHKVKLESVSDIQSIEMLDLAFDMFDVLDVDLTSILSLFSLNDAESSLKNVQEKLSKSVAQVQSQMYESKGTLLRNQETLYALKRHGIERVNDLLVENHIPAASEELWEMAITGVKRNIQEWRFDIEEEVALA